MSTPVVNYIGSGIGWSSRSIRRTLVLALIGFALAATACGKGDGSSSSAARPSDEPGAKPAAKPAAQPGTPGASTLLPPQDDLELPRSIQMGPLQRAPLITVSTQAVVFNGEHLAETADVDRAPAPPWALGEMRARLEEQARHLSANFDTLPEPDKARCHDPEPGDLLQCPIGLVIVQADKRSSAQVIHRVVATAYAAGYSRIQLAVGSRSGMPGEQAIRVTGPTPAADALDADVDLVQHPSARLSLLIQEDIVALATTGDRVRHQFPAKNGTTDWTLLGQTLQELDDRASLKNPGEIEIAAQGSISYQTLVTAMDTAISAGFPVIVLTHPDQLSARPEP